MGVPFFDNEVFEDLADRNGVFLSGNRGFNGGGAFVRGEWRGSKTWRIHHAQVAGAGIEQVDCHGKKFRYRAVRLAGQGMDCTVRFGSYLDRKDFRHFGAYTFHLTQSVVVTRVCIHNVDTFVKKKLFPWKSWGWKFGYAARAEISAALSARSYRRKPSRSTLPNLSGTGVEARCMSEPAV